MPDDDLPDDDVPDDGEPARQVSFASHGPLLKLALEHAPRLKIERADVTERFKQATMAAKPKAVVLSPRTQYVPDTATVVFSSPHVVEARHDLARFGYDKQAPAAKGMAAQLMAMFDDDADPHEGAAVTAWFRPDAPGLYLLTFECDVTASRNPTAPSRCSLVGSDSDPDIVVPGPPTGTDRVRLPRLFEATGDWFWGQFTCSSQWAFLRCTMVAVDG